MWLKDCLIEMDYLGYSPSTVRSFYEINKTSNIKVGTQVGKTSRITVEVVQETDIYKYLGMVIKLERLYTRVK